MTSRAIGRVTLAALGLAIGATAQAGVVLNNATLTNIQRGDVQDPSFSGGAYGHPYTQNTSTPQTGSTITHPASTYSYTDPYLSISGTNSGSASALPSASSFGNLHFTLTSDGSFSNPVDNGVYAGIDNFEEYSGKFTVATAETYLLTMTVNSSHVYSITGFGGGDNQEATLWLNDPNGFSVKFLDSQSSGPSPSAGPKTYSALVHLTPGAYTFDGRVETYGNINNTSSYTATGSVTGHANLSFTLQAVPEPSTLASAGTAAVLGGLACAYRSRRRTRAAARRMG
jgi:hypothetical protein